MDILKKIFMVMGVIFTVLIVIGVILISYFFIVDPFNLRGLYKEMKVDDQSASDENFDHPLLSVEQEAALKSFGLNPQSLPTEITEEQMNCAIESLGEKRAKELYQGSEPTLSDFLKAGHCLK